jgi:hypothetical protein
LKNLLHYYSVLQILVYLINKILRSIIFSCEHSKDHCNCNTYKVSYIFVSRFLVEDPNNVLCLLPYRLTNIAQLTNFFNCRLKIKSKLRLAVYRQSVSLDAGPPEAHDQRLFFNLNLAVIVLCNILSDETMSLSFMNMLALSSSVRIAHKAGY